MKQFFSCSHKKVGQKSSIGLTGLKSRHQWAIFLLGGFRGEFVTLLICYLTHLDGGQDSVPWSFRTEILTLLFRSAQECSQLQEAYAFLVCCLLPPSSQLPTMGKAPLTFGITFLFFITAFWLAGVGSVVKVFMWLN